MFPQKPCRNGPFVEHGIIVDLQELAGQAHEAATATTAATHLALHEHLQRSLRSRGNSILL